MIQYGIDRPRIVILRTELCTDSGSHFFSGIRTPAVVTSQRVLYFHRQYYTNSMCSNEGNCYSTPGWLL